jgi:nucleotide-binding universal stress UspA family protein
MYSSDLEWLHRCHQQSAMRAFSRILFPVDFSERCTGTLPFVREMVRQYGASLTLIHVVQIPMYWYGTMSPGAVIAWEVFPELVEKGRERLTSFAARHFAGSASPGTICELGDPGDAILAHAEKIGADLIMMPTQGESPFRIFLLGSVTAKVLHRAHCAVWTGAHLEAAPATEQVHVKSILCALDLEKDADDVVHTAAELGKTFSAHVRLVHCIPAPESLPAAEFNSEFERFLADCARDQIAKLQARVETSFDVSLAAGQVAKVVRDAALAHRADLIVIGRGHVQAPLSLLRTNAFGIIRNAPCPVLSLL